MRIPEVKTDRTAQAEALHVIEAQLAEAVAARKCSACGCLHQTVEAFAETTVGREALAPTLAKARQVFRAKAYDCLGCAVCYPAIAANAFAEAFPDAGEALELYPTAAPEERTGCPPLPVTALTQPAGRPVTERRGNNQDASSTAIIPGSPPEPAWHTITCLAWPVHHDTYAKHRQQSSEAVIGIRGDAINLPPPQQREDNKDAAIGGIDSSKVRRLEGGNDPIKHQHTSAQCGQPDTFPFAQP